jgi:hypothetical protein
MVNMKGKERRDNDVRHSRAKLANTILLCFSIYHLLNRVCKEMIDIPSFVFTCRSLIIDGLDVDIDEEAIRIGSGGISE